MLPLDLVTLDTTSLWESFAIFVVMGVAGVMIIQIGRGRFKSGIIVEGYGLVTGGFSQVFRKTVPVGAEAFAIGERQFLVDMAFATTREQWNRWSGLLPVLRYHIDDARPLMNSLKFVVVNKDQTDPAKALKPATLKLRRMDAKGPVREGEEGKPSSGTTNLIIRRKGAAIMIEATKKVAMNPTFVAIMVAIAVFGGSFVLFNMWHPGFAPCNPPPGYYCGNVRLPTNITVPK